MKKKRHIIRLLLSVLVVFGSIQAKAQSQAANFIKGGIQDGETLIQAYLNPLGKAMGSNLNGGWYNTAKVHRTLGFDLTLTLTAAFVADADKSFDLSESDLQHLQLKNPAGPTLAPTFAGSTGKGPVLVRPVEVNGHTVNLVEFETMGGVDLPAYPLPMIKAAVGLPAGIELMGRFVPKYSFDDTDFYMWGAGIKYDILQYFPVANRIPFLNASLMGAYTTVISSSDISFQKQMYEDNSDLNFIEGGQEHYDNQSMDINMQGVTAMGLISYDLPVFTFFGGIGYSTSSTKVSLLGDYPFLNVEDGGAEGPDIFIEDVNDPISLEFSTSNRFQYTGGIRLKFAVITLHANYTWADYNLLTAGLGFSFR